MWASANAVPFHNGVVSLPLPFCIGLPKLGGSRWPGDQVTRCFSCVILILKTLGVCKEALKKCFHGRLSCSWVSLFDVLRSGLFAFFDMITFSMLNVWRELVLPNAVVLFILKKKNVDFQVFFLSDSIQVNDKKCHNMSLIIEYWLNGWTRPVFKPGEIALFPRTVDPLWFLVPAEMKNL